MQRSWGPYIVFDPDRLVLVFDVDGYDYEVDIEECTTSAEMLDWIFQINGKQWLKTEKENAELIGRLVQAFDDLLNPQATLCSWGQEQGPINVRQVLVDHKEIA